MMLLIMMMMVMKEANLIRDCCQSCFYLYPAHLTYNLTISVIMEHNDYDTTLMILVLVVMMMMMVMIFDVKTVMMMMMMNLAKTPLSPAPRTSVVRGPADLRLKYEKINLNIRRGPAEMRKK